MASITGVAPLGSPDAHAVDHDNVKQLNVVSSSNKDSLNDDKTSESINPLLLAAVCFGSPGALNFLFNREDTKAAPMIMPTQAFLDLLYSTGEQSSNDVEDFCVEQAHALPSASLLLAGVTAEGNTALHVVATHGESMEFLECAKIIFERAQELMFAPNKKGDTPMHCAARAGRSKMVSFLTELARSRNRLHELLRKENGLKETALHDAVRIGNSSIVKSLLKADPKLAIYPEEGTSPLYLAVSLENIDITRILHDMSNGNLSFCGPNGQNALHAATFGGTVIRDVLKWNSCLTTRGDRDGSTPLHFASSFGQYPHGFHQLFQANPTLAYQADSKGLFPIHVAASMGALGIIRNILETCPSTAGLCTARGRTFLHVAVDNRRLNVVSFVSQTPSLARILNSRDHDGNTALHLAVKHGKFRIFCSLYGNKNVHVSLANNSMQTPIDLARNLLPRGLYYKSNNVKWIYKALTYIGATYSRRRADKFERLDPNSIELKPEDESKEEETVKDASQILGLGSVLITTVAFGATFALPGGYIEDDHKNGGTATRAGSYTFDAFMMANTLAFICSSMATIGLMFSGTSMVKLKSRQINLRVSVYLITRSVTSLAAAFALGVYMVVAPVALATATMVCALTSLVVLYRNCEFLVKWFILVRPLCVRMGLIRASWILVGMIFRRMLGELWPFIVIFGWATIARSLRSNR